MIRERFVLDKDGFVPEDINLGLDNGKKRVKVEIKVLSAPEGTEVPVEPIVEEYSLDRTGTISNDLALDPELGGALVEVAVSLV